jgi:hypothetical protein
LRLAGLGAGEADINAVRQGLVALSTVSRAAAAVFRYPLRLERLGRIEEGKLKSFGGLARYFS